MPEEHNRVIADHLSDLLLTPTRDADQNLLDEGIPAERIEFVGNVMIDSLRTHEAKARALEVAGELGVSGHVLVTLHRPGLVDHPDRLLEVMSVLEDVAVERRCSSRYTRARLKCSTPQAGLRPASDCSSRRATFASCP